MWGFPSVPMHGRPQRPPQSLDDALRASRLIAAALLLGQLLFLGIVAVLPLDRKADGLTPLLHAAAGLALAALPASLLLRHTLMKRAAELEGPPRFAKVLAATLASYALLEGAALFNIVALLVTGEWIPPVPVIALLLTVQLALFPRRSHFDPAA